MDEPIIAQSALEHGPGEEDVFHAYRNPIRVWDLGDGFTMMVGANAAAIIMDDRIRPVVKRRSSSFTRCRPGRFLR